jgi:hypothetical protein
LWDITWCFIEDCSEALNCKELCVAVVRCSICFDGDGERQKAVDDSIGGCKCGHIVVECGVGCTAMEVVMGGSRVSNVCEVCIVV